jgi:mRNA interferase MazF
LGQRRVGRPSTVRLSRLDCLEQPLLRRRLGTISQADARVVKAAWSQHAQLRFNP